MNPCISEYPSLDCIAFTKVQTFMNACSDAYQRDSISLVTQQIIRNMVNANGMHWKPRVGCKAVWKFCLFTLHLRISLSFLKEACLLASSTEKSTGLPGLRGPCHTSPGHVTASLGGEKLCLWECASRLQSDFVCVITDRFKQAGLQLVHCSFSPALTTGTGFISHAI